MTLTTWRFVQPSKGDHPAPSNTDTIISEQPKWFTEIPIVWQRYLKAPETFTGDEIAKIDKQRLSARLIVANFIAMFDGQIARGNCKNARRRVLYLEFLEQTADTTKIQKFFSDVDREQQRLLTSSPASAEPWAAYQHAGMIAACTMALREIPGLKIMAYASIDTEIEKIKNKMLAFAAERASQIETEAATTRQFSKLMAHANAKADKQRAEKAERVASAAQQAAAAAENKKAQSQRNRQNKAAEAGGFKPNNAK